MSLGEEGVAELRSAVETEVAKAVVGLETALELALVALLVRGHVLFEGVPGTGKTLLAKALARALGGEFRRIQFTPDLMPSDVVGTSVFDLASSTFRLARGPVFTDVLLADEVNRTPPKTQSALLEAMEERRVSIDGVDHELSRLFTVFATENPIEHEGTYPLPEAQLDRFLLQVILPYPGEEEEREMLRRVDRGLDPHDLDRAGVRAVADAGAIDAAREAVGRVRVEAPVLDYVRAIVASTRRAPDLALGAGPRASVHLLRSSKALAALRAHDFVTPDDVKSLAPPVLTHRLHLDPSAELEGRTAGEVLARLVESVPVPR